MIKCATVISDKLNFRSRRTRVKLCGLCSEEDVDWAVEIGTDAIGLVFYPPSPRYVSIELAAALVRRIPAFVSVVGLFVNADNSLFEQVLDGVPLGVLQFHGDETPQRCQDLAGRARLNWLRALHIGPDTSPINLVELALSYASATGLLLDTLVAGYGGGGKVFDWSLIPTEIAHRAILSGGLNIRNVVDAIHQIHPYAVDVSSGIEVPGEKGIKDHAKMASFIDAVRAADRVSDTTGIR
ncbi:phosphoribosylanthranilate isomerase [Candidatus Vallotia tarda]|uniref:N-(5'-phosphoribosyl)anthranilate isomerase n=1 Tax=Candidatus Vallotiella hemipterorum TaxID=1177213 RepID=A0A916JT06_9BURK|nr:phosphoribosylanthranilate isomerase [Candidatus Vallotia tarda]CAG7601368.1 N-(5'-phosphoribosyl)anthranilate isomerase [Candidatus Vallotia tarda]